MKCLSIVRESSKVLQWWWVIHHGNLWLSSQWVGLKWSHQFTTLMWIHEEAHTIWVVGPFMNLLTSFLHVTTGILNNFSFPMTSKSLRLEDLLAIILIFSRFKLELWLGHFKMLALLPNRKKLFGRIKWLILSQISNT